MPEKRDRRLVKGLVIGSVIASLVTLLLTPKTGSEFRSEVRRRGRDLGGWAAERASEAKDRGAVQMRSARQQMDRALGTVGERGSVMVDTLRRRGAEEPEEGVEDRQGGETEAPQQSSERLP